MRFRAHVRWAGEDPFRREDIFVAVDAETGDAAAQAAHAKVQAERKGGRTLVYAVTPLSALEGEEVAPAPAQSQRAARKRDGKQSIKRKARKLK